MTEDEIKFIQDAIAKEGRIEGDHVVVPDDFFQRLNAALNPPREGKSIIDQLVDGQKNDQ